MITFALIGAAGYVAKKHLQAIKDIGGNLIVTYDTSDSVGILDSYFPMAKYYARYDQFTKEAAECDYIVICSPNHTHFGYVWEYLAKGKKVICEKPLVIKSRQLDILRMTEKSNSGELNIIMQLRLDPTIKALKEYCAQLISMNQDIRIDVLYNSYRGQWYDQSWKADKNKSGGIAFNLGIHIIDVLIYLVGSLKIEYSNSINDDGITFNLKNENADIRVLLLRSMKGQTRNITINGQLFEIGGTFNNLHTRSYERIINGNGFKLDDVRESIEIAEQLSNE